eukprot:CAMPEP_0168421232 /NCGR_PEP_ID=MMETSP0228-20121227/33176_1 /TAXON_ID=133427 /ORGANISM="Protoceratium reticulatum, Strain CCCM 535 (=CCMP 1889)" /LENGTH=479 /DNA_ID=CAMNT_0008435135 /DNA_START=14 /DNA_END=1453 /DNA_ORIENTATION=+
MSSCNSSTCSSSGSASDDSGSDTEAHDEPIRLAATISVAVTGVVGILLGYDIGIIAGALLPISKYFDLDDPRKELFVGMFNCMALPGSLCGGPLAERLGRRLGLAAAAAVFLAGNALQTGAWAFAPLLIGRSIAGFATGMTLTMAPLYIAEVSPAKHRGRLTTFIEISYNSGIVLGYFVSWALRDLPESGAWRLMLGLGLLPPVAILAGALGVMYESPRWLASQGRTEEARAALLVLVGPEEAEVAMEQMPAGKRLEAQEEMTWLGMFRSREVRRSIFLGCSVAVLCQAMACEVIVYYIDIIFKDAGIQKDQMLLATMLVGCAKLGTIFVSAFLVDRFGRRPLLMVSSSGVFAALAVLSVSSFRGWPGIADEAATMLYVIAFSIGFGPITYIFNGEIYPQSCRAKGMSLAMGLNRITASLVSTTFLSLSNVLSRGGAFAFYAAVALYATAFVAAVVPETKGRPLEELGAGTSAAPAAAA